MRRDGTTLILYVLVALALLAVLAGSSPRVYVAAGAPQGWQAPGDDSRPTLEATRMPLTMLPVQTARAGLTATAQTPMVTATTTAATLTPSSTAVVTPTTREPTATATASASATTFATATALPNAVAVPHNTATSTTAPLRSVTHVPTREVPRQHLPTAGGSPGPLPRNTPLLPVALLCVGCGWMLLALARR